MKMSASNIAFEEIGSSIKVIPVDEVTLDARAASLATRSIKTNSKIPVVLFPGNAMQINNQADAILFLSLITFSF